MATTPPSGGAGNVSPTGNASASGVNPKTRKRTKTGCLTCRKRRIKCGEERPTCANCIKSKRQCEGYNQRVIFKPPIGDWPNHPGVVSTLQYHSSNLPGSRSQQPQRQTQPTNLAQESPLTSIQPRPLGDFDFSNVETGPGLGPSNVLGSGSHQYSQDHGYQQPLASPHQQQPLQSPHHPVPTPTSTTSSYFPQVSPVSTTLHGQFGQDTNVGYQAQDYTQGQAVYQPMSVSQAPHDQALYQRQEQQLASNGQEHSGYLSHSSVSPRAGDYTRFTDHRSQVQRYGNNPQIPMHQLQVSSADMTQAGSYNLPPAVSHTEHLHSSFQPVQIPMHDVNSDVKYMPQHAVLEQPVAISQQQKNQPQNFLSGFAGEDHVSPTQVLDEAAIEYEDDDYWDIQSDEEMLDRDVGGSKGAQGEDTAMMNKDFSLIRRIHMENSNEVSIRRYDAFLYDGILTHYKPENVANPLKNPKTARVFAHFIHVTGPSLSIYERNPRNPTSIFEGPAPPSQQGLWTYILPLKALNNQGLLHAMMALSSIHIAKLQGASITPSYKHYAYALKRLGRALGDPRKRLSIPTLATSLLLAFYETASAEHVKWSTHLVGAAQLLAELDFRSLTREARRLKAAQTAQERQFPYQNPDMLIDQKQFDQRLKDRELMPDENIVSTIIGKKVSYDDFGMVFEEGGIRQDKKSNLPGRLDLRSFETLQDLYWYYTRHDAFQSILSGNPLIMDYAKWSDCPPRAPLGRIDALYGSHDHVILLIGRIADFTARDRTRKLRQVEADGGQWRPRPGMPGFGNMGPPSMGQGRGQPPTPTTPMGPPSFMQGMGAPPSGLTSPGGPPPGASMGPPPSPGFGPGSGRGPPRGPPPASAGPTFFGMTPSRPPISLPASYANPNQTTQDSSPPTPNTPHPRYADLPAAYDAALAEWNSMSQTHATIARFLANTETFAPLTPDLYPVSPGGNMTPFGPALVHRSYDISILWALLHLSNIVLLRSHPAMPPAMMMAAGVCAQATQPYATLIGRISAGMHFPAGEDTMLSPQLGAALIETAIPLFFAGVQYQDPTQRDWLLSRLLDIDSRTGWASAARIARGLETSWEKAGEMGRGPPYKRRRTQQADEEIPVDIESGMGGQGPSGGAGGRFDSEAKVRWKSEERRFVVKRGVFAMNLLSTDEDLRVGMERVGIV